MKKILAIDQGTTGTTALVIDEAQAVLARKTVEFPQIYPIPGLVEHDPKAIWESVLEAIRSVLAIIDSSGKDIDCIGITNQRETTILWDDEGNPVYNAIVWQDRRTASFCEQLKQEGHDALIADRSGLVIDPYFSGTKIRWLLEEVAGLRRKAENGRIRFGTIDSFLVNRLTNGDVHVTDVSNASRTMLMNLRSCQWDDELTSLMDIPKRILPEIRSSSEIYGRTKQLGILPDGIPISGMAGDQQAALFGQLGFEVGDVKCTYGTGSFVVMNTGDRPIASTHRLLSTVAWQIGQKTVYALEGSAFIAGAAVQWIRDGLGLIKSASEIEGLAEKVDSAEGVYFVPALTGLGAPHWRATARGLITGINRGTTRNHLARATLEGIALQNMELIEAMQRDLGRQIMQIKVDGGAASNNLLMQLQADLSGVTIVRPRMVETTALGAALLAGLANGVWKSFSELSAAWKEDRRFTPERDHRWRQSMIDGWRAAVQKA